MSKIQSATVVLFTIFSLIASRNAADYHWIVQSDLKPDELPSPLTRESSHELLLKQLSKKDAHQLIFEMRSEFYTMATGKDFYRLVADETENKEYHAIAEATVILSQKLSYMTAVTSVLRTAFRDGASNVSEHKDITKGLPAMKETIEKAMQSNPTLYEEYKRLKGDALAKPLPAEYKIFYYEIPKTLEDAKNIVAESLNDPYLKKLMVHNTIAFARNSTDPETGLLVKSILQLAKDPELGSKVQTLYDEVLAEVANKIEDIDGKKVNEMHLKEQFIQIAKDFFKSLAIKFENDPDVKTKFAETKAEISKSQ